MERTLIPIGTVARATILVKMGETSIPEFGNGQWFKASQTSSAKWMERSEERRVGKEGRSRWSAYHEKKKKNNG